ncbi:GspH/FimT family pseudopilin [Methylibium sp.]|uniref:GspH/FimT family pseudopilin n=1 Tax=Methylibium sp. TaxID=2067992 RepID=UPI0018206F4B|nr:GspH/FimT family pseudopilin [Methylibium sp.]MBA3588772.1 GspH/FimT family pseudopilin [Methylibium sp.]
MNRVADGFTVIELMAVVLITAVLLTLAVPAFLDLLARRRLEGAANELSTDLHYARSEAVSRQLDVALTTLANGTGYEIAAASTPAPTEIKRVALPAELTVTGGVSLTYTGLRGIPLETSGGDESITVSSSRTAAQLQVDNNFMGRVRLCSPDGSFKGYAPC